MGDARTASPRDHRMPADELARSYRASRLRTAELLADITPEQEHLVVPTCPDWSVRNLVAHITALADDLSLGKGPTDGDVPAWVQGQVDERADTPIATMVDEWATSGPRFEAAIGQSPGLANLVYDLVTHEHDIAGALGTASDRDTPEIRLALNLHSKITTHDLAVAGLNAIAMHDGTESWEYGSGPIELDVRASTFELFRMIGGRRSFDQMMAADYDGDMARYAEPMLHEGIPVVDIDE